MDKMFVICHSPIGYEVQAKGPNKKHGYKVALRHLHIEAQALANTLNALLSSREPQVVEVTGCEVCPFNYDYYRCVHPSIRDKDRGSIQPDCDKLPDRCPLRNGAITIKLKEV